MALKRTCWVALKRACCCCSWNTSNRVLPCNCRNDGLKRLQTWMPHSPNMFVQIGWQHLAGDPEASFEGRFTHGPACLNVIGMHSSHWIDVVSGVLHSLGVHKKHLNIWYMVSLACKKTRFHRMVNFSGSAHGLYYRDTVRPKRYLHQVTTPAVSRVG